MPYHVQFPGFGWEFDINPIAFSIGDYKVYWYGIIIACGLLLAVLYAWKSAPRYKVDGSKLINCVFAGMITGIIGARLYFCFFKWDYYGQNPIEILYINNGGLAIYGGIIGALLGGLTVAKIQKMEIMPVLDIAMVGFLIGQGIGRWGNFANQEAFGTNTSMPWGMYSSKVADYLTANKSLFAEKGITVDPSLPVHPTFLYESLWCIIGFFIIYYICRKHYKFAGELILCYGIIYGAERAVVEGFRTDSLYIPGTTIRISQLLSAIIAVLCLAILIAKLVELKKYPKPYDPVEVLPAELDYVVKSKKKDEERAKAKNIIKTQQKKKKQAEKGIKGGK